MQLERPIISTGDTYKFGLVNEITEAPRDIAWSRLVLGAEGKLKKVKKDDFSP
jgi:hypothetical protein